MEGEIDMETKKSTAAPKAPPSAWLSHNLTQKMTNVIKVKKKLAKTKLT
jgi:hypothetical protein